MLEGDLHRLLALVRLLTDQHLVQHDAEGVDVAAGVGGAAGDELGGEVGDRPQKLLSGRRVRRRGPGQSEVADLDASVLGEQHVLRLDVAMHDPGAVRGGEAREDRIHDGDGLRDREPLLLPEQFAQRDAGQVLHHEVGELAVLSLIEDVDDVRVREAGRGAGFLDEAALEGGVVAEVRVHHLEGDAPLEPEIRGDVDRRHPATCDPCAHTVAAVDKPPDEGVGLLIGRHVRILWRTA